MPENFRTLQAHNSLTLNAVLMSVNVSMSYMCTAVCEKNFDRFDFFFVYGMPFSS